jgi:hypoxanthine phosphoribosyltransferase
MMNAIKDDIQKHGFIGHIVVQKKNSKGIKNVVINGEHRLEALKQLESQEIPTIVLDVDDKTAKLLTLRLNREHGELMPDKVADLLRDLQPDQDLEALQEITQMDQRELAVVLQFDDTVISDKIIESTSNAPEVNEVAGDTILWTWDYVEQAVKALGDNILKRFDNAINYFSGILAIPNGGIIPARLLARELDFYGITYPHYQENILTTIPAKSRSRRLGPLLIVDDIYDSGKTYQHILTKIPKEDFHYACLASRKMKSIPDNLTFGMSLGEDKRWIRFPWENKERNEKKRKEIDTIMQ